MLKVLGAGLPRTGTSSLRAALERLLDGRCYHMHEVFEHLDHVPFWRSALAGEAVDWRGFLAPYVAGVDWPVSAFWRELSAVYPDAIVVLSLRDSAQAWWESANATVLPTAWKDQPPELAEWQVMVNEVLNQRFTAEWRDPQAAMAAYDRHVALVRATVPAERLVEWHATDGWPGLCSALGVPVPDEPFPHLNRREEW